MPFNSDTYWANKLANDAWNRLYVARHAKEAGQPADVIREHVKMARLYMRMSRTRRELAEEAKQRRRRHRGLA